MTGRAVVEVAWPGGAVFSAGDINVLVHERTAATADRPVNEDHVAFSVADVDRACDELRADGIDVLIAPHDSPWGCSAYLRDPDGSMLELSQA
jgi:catechol 2,3-dioxygenase-like lactoylglutathione lyase family enzyme